MDNTSNNRAVRLAASARRELADMIQSKFLKGFKDDEKIKSLISITEVKVDKGYQHFRVFFSILGENEEKEILKIFQDATPLIRGELCRRLKMRVAPTITFHLDDSLKRGFNLWQKLDEIKCENI